LRVNRARSVKIDADFLFTRRQQLGIGAAR